MIAGGITVTGLGEVEIVPDRCVIRLGVQVVEANVSTALRGAAAAAAEMVGVFHDAGIAPTDLATTRLSLRPEHDHSSGRPQLVGHRASHIVEARVADLDTVGELIDRAVTAGGEAATIESVGYEATDPIGALDRARANAWRDAEVKARQLAAMAGLQIGSAEAISEDRHDASPETRRALASAATPVQPGSLAASVSLVVRFAIAR